MLPESQWREEAVVAALWVILIGTVVAIAAAVFSSFSAVGDYWSAGADAAKIALIDANRTQFAIGFGGAGLGTAIIGVGMFLFGKAIAPIEMTVGRRRRAIVARLAAWSGIIVGLWGVSGALHAVAATPTFLVESSIGFAFTVAGSLALVFCSVVFGVLGWKASPPKWSAVVLIIGGLTVLGIPDIVYLALLVFTIANLVVSRSTARSVPARPATM